MIVDKDCVRGDLNSPDNTNSRWDFAEVRALFDVRAADARA
jgi:hypothetical protein